MAEYGKFHAAYYWLLGRRNLVGIEIAARSEGTQSSAWWVWAILTVNKINRLVVEKVRPQSRSLRHLPSRNCSPNPAAARFFRCFRGLCRAGYSPTSVLGSPKVLSLCRYSLDLLPAAIW